MKDVKGYITDLNKSMTTKEKLFFFNKINLNKYDYIVDFGCANGAMLRAIDKKLKRKAKTTLIGIDNSTQIKVDQTAFAHTFIKAWGLMDLVKIDLQDKKVLLILSSVLHELDFHTFSQIIDFAETYATTVCVRDMCFNINDRKQTKEEVKALTFITKIGNLELPNRPSASFSARLYEYFLKYTYTKNWDSEIKENYFSSNVPNLLYILNEHFRTVYKKHYILPFKKKQVYQDFGYKMTANTHLKLILEKR